MGPPTDHLYPCQNVESIAKRVWVWTVGARCVRLNTGLLLCCRRPRIPSILHPHHNTHTHAHPLPLPTLPPILHTICHRMRMQWNISRELAQAGGQSLPINHARELMRSHQHNKYMDATYFTPAEMQSTFCAGFGWLSCMYITWCGGSAMERRGFIYMWDAFMWLDIYKSAE